MLRDKNLIPLSHQHQHALALCVRIDRGVQGGDVETEPWQAEIQQIYEQEIALHFAAEEKEVFPAAQKFAELRKLVQELLAEHARLRDFFARATERNLSAAGLREFAGILSGHIRKEERQLFEELQRLLPADDLAALGNALDKELKNASDACILPTPATRLRPRSKS
jgi:hemerythrin-like domain-containing protein